MQTRVCFVYPWATFGGVERVLLNRILAFKHFLPSVKVDICFEHDAGGLLPLIEAINQLGLEANVFTAQSLTNDYDLVFVIDFPKAVDWCINKSQRFVVECHTAYHENRKYLSKLSYRCERVITPSSLFSNLIRSEFPLLAAPVCELRNFVPWDITPEDYSISNCLPGWKRKPILFFGRFDNLKDPLSLLDAFQMLEQRRKGEFMLLLCGPRSWEIDLEEEISRRSLEDVSVTLPPIPFTSAGSLLSSVAQAGGIFVSPSKGESFGLSAAEAISSLVPVVLSDIDAHAALVKGFEEMLTYPLGDVKQLSERIESIFDNYVEARDAVAAARNSFSAGSFIEDWRRLFFELDLSLQGSSSVVDQKA